MTDTDIAPPDVSTTEAPPASTGQRFEDMLGGWQPGQSTGMSPPEAKTETKSPVGTVTNAAGQQLAAEPGEKKPEPMVETKTDAKKSKLDGIKIEKKEEKPAAAPEKPKTAEDNIRILRLAKEEWDKVRPEYEKLKGDFATRETELGTLREELTKLKAMGLNEQERAEYARYREMHARDAVTNSAEFQQNIMAPIKAVESDLTDIAKRAGLDDNKASSLFEAVNTPNKFDRSKAIRAVLKEADLDVEDYQTYVDAASSAANRLHEDLYPKHDAIIAQAEALQASAKDREKAMAEESKAKDSEAFNTHREALLKELSDGRFRAILEDTDLNIDGVTMLDAARQAAQAEDPEGRAYQAIAAHALPFIVAWAQKQYDEVAKLRNGSKASVKAAPSLRDGAAPEAASDKPQISWDDVLNAHGR